MQKTHSKDYVQVTYREIAKMFAKALPVEGNEFRERVEANLEAIKSLSTEAKTALKAAYIFSSKVPRQEREDFFQDLALAVYEAHTKDEKLAYAIARCDWLNWWKKHYVRQNRACLLNGIPQTPHCKECTFKDKPKKFTDCPFRAYRQMVESIDVLDDKEGKPETFANMVLGETEWELKMDGALDVKIIWDMLPAKLQAVVRQRLLGQMVSPFDALELQEWAAKHAMYLV